MTISLLAYMPLMLIGTAPLALPWLMKPGWKTATHSNGEVR
jgi:hypothetical protein